MGEEKQLLVFPCVSKGRAGTGFLLIKQHIAISALNTRPWML